MSGPAHERAHSLPVASLTRHELILSYAWPLALLEQLIPEGVELDAHDGLGFIAASVVQTEDLRPRPLPRVFGRDCVVCCYRILVRSRDRRGREERRLHVLRSDTDGDAIARIANPLASGRSGAADVRVDERLGAVEIEVRTPDADADMHVFVDLAGAPAPLPPTSPFDSVEEARRFASHVPFTNSDRARGTERDSIEGTPSDAEPRSVAVDVRELTFFERGPFSGLEPRLASAFHLADVEYARERARGEAIASRAARIPRRARGWTPKPGDIPTPS